MTPVISRTAVTISFNNSDSNVLYAKEKPGHHSDHILENRDNESVQDQNTRSKKVVILTFGDIHKSQFTTAKPILDQYNFKVSFFVPCGMVDKDSC